MHTTMMSLRDAEALARDRVSKYCPALASVEPKVTQRQAIPGGHDVPGMVPAAEAQEYIFIFRSEIRTNDGHTLPQIARVVVDRQQGVKKITMSHGGIRGHGASEYSGGLRGKTMRQTRSGRC
ncbi:hypothetical protein HC891_22845 [Candidatus Gracilibacteria bacterium]|nr:hypothetical protein [Candidatus Gracilibacteria bacterium]